MELKNVERHLLSDLEQVVRGRIDEDAYSQIGAWERRYELPGAHGSDVAGALAVEIEAEGVGTGFDSGERIFQIRYA